MDVDTGQFQALTERAERAEGLLRDIDAAAEIMGRAREGEAPDDTAWQPKRRARHLRAVE
jgi:hypothetical protein